MKKKKESYKETCFGLQTAIYTLSQLVISLKSAHISNTSSLPRCHDSCTSERHDKAPVRVSVLTRERGGRGVLGSIARVS